MRIEGNFAAALLAAAVLILPGCQSSSSTIGRSAVSVAKASQAESGRLYSLGPQFESQLEEMISREVVALGGKENVPMELNRQVLLNINYFLNDARGFMTRGLSLGSKYIPMMKAIFRQKGLPEDLVYLALIESGFRTQAVSHASAVGPWQFIAATGKRYGLTIDEWVDERRDPVKSTYAAADYLTALHDMFNSWPLAIAAYNSGEGKIIRGMKNHGIDNFWDMTDGGLLANETKLYVPSFLAATFIAKDPAAYGLQIETQAPDQWDDVVVSGAVSLKDAAKFSGSTVERLKELNPHLKKDSTPPHESSFVLRVPAGSGSQFAKAYGASGLGRATASKDSQSGSSGQPRLSSLSHTVKQGESLGTIAKRYGVSVDTIRKNNGLKSDALKVGQVLTIKSDLPLTAQKKSETGPVMVVERKAVTPRSTNVHVVASGESLGVIAQKYDMSVRELVDINNIKGTTIKPGQKLTVKNSKSAPWEKSGPSTPPAAADTAAGGSGGSAPIHVVAAGESLGIIAQKYKISTKELMTLNKLEGPNIKIGQKLKVGPEKAAAAVPAKAPEQSKPASASGVHVVSAGENVGGIARKYNLTAKELMDLNNLENTNIKIGQKLKVVKSSAPKTAGAQSSAAGVHTVAAGENLGLIAGKYGLTVNQLMALNNLSDSNIRIGQKLSVGGPASSSGGASTYKVVSGDTLLGIAHKNNIPVDQLKKINKLETNSIRVGQILKLK